MRPLHTALSVATSPIGWVLGKVLLAAVFFGLIAPLALWFRLRGRDVLGRRPQPEAPTYWQPRRPVTGGEQYYRQF